MKISIVVPFHWMKNWAFFLERCLKSIEAQSFKDYEVILVKHSTMPTTSNRAIESARGDLIKVLYMDDYFAHGNALQEIVDAFDSSFYMEICERCLNCGGTRTGNFSFPCDTDCIGKPTEKFERKTKGFRWLVSGCVHDVGDGKLIDYHEPKYTHDIYTGNNGIGSPSVLTMSREGHILFDTSLSWLLDCDLYQRLYELHGPPTILSTPNVAIGLHDGQASNLMSDEDKTREHRYMMDKQISFPNSFLR